MKTCPDCKEPENTECDCIRNKCHKCLKTVGSDTTLNMCDDCWNKTFNTKLKKW